MLEGVVSGILSGIITAVVLGMSVLAWQSLRTRRFKVRIVLPKSLIDQHIRLGLLHATNDDGQIINRVHRFKKSLRSIMLDPDVEHTGGLMKLGPGWKKGLRSASFRYPRGLGFQYKCFVDYAGEWSADQVSEELKKWGCINPDEGSGKPQRFWFLIPGYPTAGLNNTFYPE